MAEISNAINMSFRVDKELKKEADTLFKKMGLNTSVALNMFLRQSVEEQGMPFSSNLNPKPSRRLLKALKEAEEIRTGKKTVKGYHNINELIEDLLK